MTPLNWQDHDLTHPLSLTEPHRIDVPDIFGDGFDDATRDQYFAVMALTPQHTYMLATEWPARMAEYFNSHPQLRIICASVELQTPETRFHNQAGTDGWWPMPNVWLGTSVENQATADERIPHLLKCPAAVRFLSCEPLLGPVDLTGSVVAEGRAGSPRIDSIDARGMWMPRIDWVIVGGESGHGARPMHPDWVRSLRDQCAAAGVPFAFEGWGEWAPASIVSTGPVTHAICRHGCVSEFTQEAMRAACGACNSWEGLRRVGRAASGRLLDGVQHDAYPQVESEVAR